jgi:hypothetical protein
MSAYDNPTIIKDESAMAWVTGLAGAGQAFTESYNIARKEREAREKADKEQSIKDQVLLSQLEYKDQEEVQKGAEGLQKKGASPSALTSRNTFFVDINKVRAKNTQEISTKVLSKEDLAAKNKYASDVTTVEAKFDSAFGAAFSQAAAIKNNEIGVGDISNYIFNGDDLLSQGIGKAVCLAFAFENTSKATKGLEYDVNDPLGAKVDVKIPLNNLNDLKEVFKAANVMASTEEIDQAIADGIKNKSIIAEGAPGKENYTIKYNPKVTEWTGEFYTKIPDIGLGETSTTVGIYSKEGGNKITNNYLEPTRYEKLEGNAGMPGSEGTARYQATEVKEAAVKEAMRPTAKSQAAGLISAYFNNNATGNGILRKLDFGTNYPLKQFLADHEATGMAGMVDTLAEKIIEKEWQNIIIKSDLKEIIDPKTKTKKYYEADAQSVAFFNKPEKTSGKDKTTTEDKEAVSLDENIKSVWKTKAEDTGTYKGDKGTAVVHENGRFIITAPEKLKDRQIGTKAKVVEFLKTGKY